MFSCVHGARRVDRRCLPSEAGLWLAWTAPRRRLPWCGGRRMRDGCGVPACISSSSMTARGPSAPRIRARRLRHGWMKTMPPRGRGLLPWSSKRAEPCRRVACHLSWSTVHQAGHRSTSRLAPSCSSSAPPNSPTGLGAGGRLPWDRWCGRACNTRHALWSLRPPAIHLARRSVPATLPVAGQAGPSLTSLPMRTEESATADKGAILQRAP